MKFILRAKGRRLVLRSYPFYVLSLQNSFVEASFWSSIRHPWIPRPIIILIVTVCGETQPKETYVLYWAGEKDYQVWISSCLDPQEKKRRHLLIFWVQKSHLHLQPISDSITVTNTYWTRIGSVCAGDEIEANNEGGSPGDEIFFGEIWDVKFWFITWQNFWACLEGKGRVERHK